MRTQKVRLAAAAGVVVGMLAVAGAAGASTATRTAKPHSNCWATATSAASCGGMKKLIAAAKAEGGLNVIADPTNWANYGNIFHDFTKKYGVPIRNDFIPGGSSQDEITWLIQHKGEGTGHEADAVDVGLSHAAGPGSGSALGLFAPYKVTEWNELAPDQKQAKGLYYSDYGGYISIGYNAKYFSKPPTWSTFTARGFHLPITMNGDPTMANAAFSAVFAASLANGGSLNNIQPGINYWHKINAAGNYVPEQTTPGAIESGEVKASVDWDYLNQGYVSAFKQKGLDWKVVIPSTGRFAFYYQQAVAKYAPDPAAARLWEEFLYSTQGQNLWLEGFARPALLTYMTKHGTVNEKALAALPRAGSKPFSTPTLAQTNKATAVVLANWSK